MKLKKQASRNIKTTIFLCITSILAASSSLAIDLESTYAEHAKYCMSQLKAEEQTFLNGYLIEKLRKIAFSTLSKKLVKNLMLPFSRIKLRMKNIDEHWLFSRHFQMRETLIVFRKKQTVRLRGTDDHKQPKISEVGPLCRPRRATHQSVRNRRKELIKKPRQSRGPSTQADQVIRT